MKEQAEQTRKRAPRHPRPVILMTIDQEENLFRPFPSKVDAVQWVIDNGNTSVQYMTVRQCGKPFRVRDVVSREIEEEDSHE